MKAWLVQHAAALRRALDMLRHAGWSALANVLVTGIALALPLGAYTLLVNLERAAQRLDATPEISVFVTPDAKRAEALALESALKALAGVKAVRFVARETALASLKSAGHLGELAATLGANPLPDAWIVTLNHTSGGLLQQHAASITKMPRVDQVQVDTAWVQRAGAALQLGRYAVLMLAAMLSLALVAVAFNTIRLQVLTQHAEIELSQLLGATDGFIQRPFLYAGAVTGALGGAAALGMVYLALQVLAQPVTDLARSYATEFSLQYLTAADAATAALFAAGLGWLGAFLSLRQQLR